MAKTLPIIFCLVILAGCRESQPPGQSTAATSPTNLPPKLAAFVNTPEGKRVLDMVTKMKEQVDRTKDTLLHKTDHRAVLIASREVIRTRRDYKRDPKWHGGQDDPEQYLIAPDDPKLPVVIQKLGAASIFGYDDRLRIEFGGGFHHQGFVAYATNTTEIPSGQEGFQNLIDGLWFYEDTH